MPLLPPSHESLTTRELGKVFESTTATYKFYWFLALLDRFVRKGDSKISVKDMTISMVAHAWYTVNYFKLSFGMWDSLYEVVHNLQSMLTIPMDSSKLDVFDFIQYESSKKDVSASLKKLSVHVPYRFLSPWISYKSNSDVVARSQQFENQCLYSLNKENGEFYVVVNPLWREYLNFHYQILKDFTYWNLTLFLQSRNPNVPNIPSKLVRPDMRDTMSKQHAFWDEVIQNNVAAKCIFTDKTLVANEYDLDHFIPWSFVTHNQLWNLVPVDPSINSSKSDQIPDLERFLPKFAAEHRLALEMIDQNGKFAKDFKVLIEDYSVMGPSINGLLQLSEYDFTKRLHEVFDPLAQIALNMGFKSWKYGA